jgi:endonuclease/exonuclease/phosphatase family metal-dependent hydrolase
MNDPFSERKKRRAGAAEVGYNGSMWNQACALRLGLALVLLGCGGSNPARDPMHDAALVAVARNGRFLALTYNVAGLPEGLSQSMPARYTPIIGPLLNAYDLVLLQESWQTPEDNPLAPLRVYHEILVASADHPYKTQPAEHPLGNDASRPSAQLGDGLNLFSRFALGETTRVRWDTCVDTASDCLAFKGFSMTPAQLADGLPVHVYNLHMEAGRSQDDDEARAAGLDQLMTFITARSRDTALIVGGDFNLDTDEEPAKSQFARLLQRTGLSDSCTELKCADPGSIDKLLYRSTEGLELSAESWARESDVFVSEAGEPLSDHLPVAVRLAWIEKPARD